MPCAKWGVRVLIFSVKYWLRKLSLLVVYGCARFLCGLRYRVKVQGIDQVKGKGILFLPNHAAEIDPILMMLVLQKFQPRPLVVEHFFYLKGFESFMHFVGALPMPNLSGSVNRWKVKQVDKLLNQVAEGLKNGENFLIYPAGRLKEGENEVIGGASFITNLLHLCPDIPVVLVRTRGLWGSQFSRAWTGAIPDFGKTLLRGASILLKNGIFFAPRREVCIEVTNAPAHFPRAKNKLELNRYLEDWYNAKRDPLTFVPFYFWKKTEGEREVKQDARQQEELNVPSEVEALVLAELGKLAHRKQGELKKEMHLAQDLGLDSLDVAELVAFLDERCEVGEVTAGSLITVRDVLQVAAGKREEKKEEKSHPPKKGLKRWRGERHRPPIQLPEGATIQEAFLRSCDRMGSHIACGDHLTGIMSYRQLKVAALVLSQYISNIPDHHIGVMLPASVGTYLVIFAILLAGKVPVMLNWTAGKRALDHSLEIAQVTTVLSSFRFLSRLGQGELGDVDEKFLFLENIRRTITLKQKLKGWLWGQLKAPTLLKKLPLNGLKSDERGVILFTSGTETLPKGVPLSHDNLLSNQRAALSTIQFTAQDVLFGFLPPFHSFGFSPTGVMPFLCGWKVCFHPDPTDGKGLSFDISYWKPTVLCSAPSFVNGILRASGPEDLASLRLIVVGAEKAPQELLDKIATLEPPKKLLEGYGITECSPIVTLDRMYLPHVGVGKALLGMELMVIHPDTEVILGQGEEGEVCISGPSVFQGYLPGTGVKDPFIHFAHKRWYRSGDLGKIDAEGHLILVGRLKRFIKIGGEMVSLSGLEEDLLQISQEKNWATITMEGPPLAVIAQGQSEQDKLQIILFLTFDQSKEEINALLREKGSSRLSKISEVVRLEHIPLTGTGKTHYRKLEELWQSERT